MAISYNTLSQYVNENSAPITKNLVFGAPSIKLLSVMSDVKGDAALNLLNTSIAFGDGATCGWSDNGTATLSQRTLSTQALKINIPYCARQLQKYWIGQEANFKIGIETLPFEEKFVDDAVSNVCKSLDKMIWYGDASTALNFDGLCTICADDASAASPKINVVNASAALDGSLYTKLQKVIETIPAEQYNDAIVVMSVTTFRGVIADFESKNPYKSLEFVTDDKLCFIAPNTNIKVYGLIGMEKSGKKDMMAFDPRNVFYGCDYADADETFKFRYDEHDDQFELHMLLNAGVQVAFLDEMVWAPTK